jgi:hypothetical protein
MNYMRVALKAQKVETRKDPAIDTPVTDDTTALTPVDPNAEPEKLNVDASAVPPSSNEARQAAEKANANDVQEAAKPQPAAPAPVLPAAPVVPKPAP